MAWTYWLRRFALALLVALPLLFGVGLLKGMAMAEAALHAAVWGVLTAATFSLVAYLRYRRNPACMLPRQGGEKKEPADAGS